MRRKITTIIIASVIISACGCAKDNNTQTSTTAYKETGTSIHEIESMEPATTKAVTKEIPKMVFFRRNKDAGTFEPGADIKSTWSYHNDIASFYVFPENAQAEGFLYDGFTDYWKKLWADYGDSDRAKIGYELTISLADGTDIVKKITKPSDTEEFYDYIEIYLYDDIHQEPGAWYSHLTDGQITGDTLMTSIKVTAGVNVDKVVSVGIKTFSYADEDMGDSHASYVNLYNTI